MRAIDADILSCAIKDILIDPNMPMYIASEIDMIINLTPTIDCQIKTGNWIKITNTLYKCDQCGAVQLKGNYCKDCGAKMEGVNK